MEYNAGGKHLMKGMRCRSNMNVPDIDPVVPFPVLSILLLGSWLRRMHLESRSVNYTEVVGDGDCCLGGRSIADSHKGKINQTHWQ